MRDAGLPSAIDRLSLRFRLAPFDEDLLLLSLSSQLHGRPHRVTMQAVRDIFGITNDEAAARLWDRLAVAGPLRRFRLMEEPEYPLLPGSPLFIDERIGRYLMGEDLADPRTSGMVNAVNGGPCPRRHIAGVERLTQKVHASPRPVAMIVGPKNSGRRAAATVLASSFGLKLAELNPRPLEASPERELLGVAYGLGETDAVRNCLGKMNPSRVQPRGRASMRLWLNEIIPGCLV